ncbi:unnamed protein product [Rotaria socialis]|uniref:Uncharacterized protein n=1 Tax=Rotaria socialis TaxID=392032 RepID=A0A820Y3N0_9BILA|nr:unnamed protein product [Rotaria socialis]CAF4542800.1 unnamed protein product [Rotaria socialis]
MSSTSTLFNEFRWFVESMSTSITGLDQLIEKAKYIDVVQVKNVDNDLTYRQLPCVIIRSLIECHPKKRYTSLAFRNMLEVLTISPDGVVSSTQRSKMMCLLAMIKSDFDEDALLSAIIRTNSTVLIDIESAPTTLLTWEKFIESVICHNECDLGHILLNEVPIEFTIWFQSRSDPNKDLFGPDSAPVNTLVDDLISSATGKSIHATSEKISVKLVHSTIKNLRGCTGINTICINILYINDRHEAFKISSSLSDDDKNVIFKMTLFCVGLHEYSHARLRQVENNPNTSSSNLLSNKSTIVETYGGKPEFGRLTEHKLFGAQLDFWETDATGKWTALHSAYFAKFVQAIETNQSLTSFNADVTPCSTRTSHCAVGSDIDVEDIDIYYEAIDELGRYEVAEVDGEQELQLNKYQCDQREIK